MSLTVNSHSVYVPEQNIIKPEQVDSLVKKSVDDVITEQYTSPSILPMFSNENSVPTNQIKVANIAEYLNDRLSEFSSDLSAEVVQQGGNKFVEIKDTENGVIIKRISDERLLDYMSQREHQRGLLLNTKI
ncbi:flagellar protein FlaG [Vibrio panuliri]|uniref:Flagellar protein FlaG n=1 Tax=Vibrio panuliri TaxID=1381081 RepID=A0ABX3FE55_9VIBR|nr:flagellar protein FlaG [Vibrio panuliri]KAB1454345.1 flagellar protein FlaG [Vibrio panuliri]OLQ87833.1 hypothetical protein BIY20_02330 [Vibrio panuliri]